MLICTFHCDDIVTLNPWYCYRSIDYYLMSASWRLVVGMNVPFYGAINQIVHPYPEYWKLKSTV
jgi:hypothetical protein